MRFPRYADERFKPGLVPDSCPTYTDVMASAIDWLLRHDAPPDVTVGEAIEVAERMGWSRALVPSREQSLAMMGREDRRIDLGALALRWRIEQGSAKPDA